MSTSGNAKCGHLILWGETAVGKSTLCIAGLSVAEFQVPIDWTAPGAEQRAWVQSDWRRLSLGYPLPQTGREGRTVELPVIGGGLLRIVDIQGRSSQEAGNALKLIPRDEPFAGLFVCSWADQRTEQYLAVIDSVLNYFQGRPVGLAVTKSDRGLDAFDPHWHAEPGWWAEHPCWRPHERILRRFGPNVWPLSAYGFNNDGQPCCVLDEFGNVLPYRIQPRNVSAPFNWAFKELGLWPSN
jgi:hypothetical protein